MEKLRYYLKRYPNRIKYGIFFLDIIAMMIAIRAYVNYDNIVYTIDSTIIEKEMKTQELAFGQNFLVHYEKSDFAKYFLQHENNMLLPGEYIIKFEENVRKVTTGEQVDTPKINPLTSEIDNANQVNSPQDSRKRFLGDKVK